MITIYILEFPSSDAFGFWSETPSEISLTDTKHKTRVFKHLCFLTHTCTDEKMSISHLFLSSESLVRLFWMK